MATFQAQELNPNTFFASASIPSGQSKVGNYVASIKAYVDASTTLSSFKKPITITLTYNASDLSGIDSTTLSIYRYDDGAGWTALSGCTTDTGAYTVTCQTSDFSDFALFGQAKTNSSSTTNSSTNQSQSGGSVQSQYNNLIAMGFTTLAEQLKARYAYLGSNELSTGLPTVRDVTVGDTGADVTAIQNFLIQAGYLEAQKNTGYFGTLTQVALAKYQSANGIIPAEGYYGPKTRAFMEGNMASSTTALSSTTISIFNTSFTRNLNLGYTGSDVKALQQYLNNHGFIVSANGGGSLGNETTYFGKGTQSALVKAQTADGIHPASGYFGPVTRAYVSSH